MSTTGDRPASGSPPSRPGAGRMARKAGATVRVLVIEDHAEMAEAVATGLRRAQMAVGVAFDRPAGPKRALTARYDVIPPDPDPPGLHGHELCARLVAPRCRGPVHQRGEDHHQPAAGQARRPPAHRDSAQVRLPDRRMTVAVGHRLTTLAAAPGLSPRTIRMRLTLIYGGLFLICGAGLLAITYVLVSNATAGYFSATGPNGSTVGGYAGRRGRPPPPPPAPPRAPGQRTAAG